MLSIVIPCHRRVDLLRRCLDAVTRHAPKHSEIIVVDDASPAHGASDVARSFQASAVRFNKQCGFAAAANAGIRASRGAVIELLNDDTEVQPGWADAALAWFDDPAVGAVAPLLLIGPDGTHIDSAGDVYDKGGFAFKRWHRQPRRAIDLVATPVFGASAAAAFYRRAALEQTGLFPESFGSYFEDVDLACRLQRRRWRTMFEPRSQVLHHVGASHRPGRRLLERQSRNEELLFWRNVARDRLGSALPRHAAVLLGKAARRWREGALVPWLFGRFRALREVSFGTRNGPSF
jgi:O-antigen biosynthesis protein